MADVFVYSAAIVNGSGELLIVKRASYEDQYPDYWELPGGKAEQGEKPEQALTREVLEETGLRIEEVEKEYFRFSYRNVEECHYRVRISMGSVVLNPDEHSHFKWIRSVSDIDGLLMTPELRRSVMTVINAL